MKKMFYVLLALLVSMVLVFGVSCDNSNKAPGGAEGNPPVEEPGTDVPGGDEENPDIDNPGTGEEPGGEEGSENPGEDVDEPKPEEPPVATFSPSWAVGSYSATVLSGMPLSATITEDGFDIQLTMGTTSIPISSKGDGVTVTKNEKNDAEKTWDIVLSGIQIANGGNVTVTLTSVTDNQELTGKVVLEDESLAMFNKLLSNITFVASPED